MINLTLNKESAAVLLRCLNYGEHAISQEEGKSLIGPVIEENIRLLRWQVAAHLSQEIIYDAVNKVKKE